MEYIIAQNQDKDVSLIKCSKCEFDSFYWKGSLMQIVNLWNHKYYQEIYFTVTKNANSHSLHLCYFAAVVSIALNPEKREIIADEYCKILKEMIHINKDSSCYLCLCK
jgi:hypothetical protein